MTDSWHLPVSPQASPLHNKVLHVAPPVGRHEEVLQVAAQGRALVVQVEHARLRVLAAVGLGAREGWELEEVQSRTQVRHIHTIVLPRGSHRG
jgi:hypothetical protein